jgi:hypothetical protein
VLRLDLSGEVFATIREAMAKIRRDAGESLDDDTAVLLLCRQALEGPKDPGRSSYQIALTVCESCRRAKQQGRGELIEVGPEIVAMAECDGQHIGHVNGYVDVPDARANAHVGVDDDVNIRASVHDDANARANADADGGGNARARMGATRVRATQTIPPALRRAVLRRDGGKCRVPGCRHAVYTDMHHLAPRSEHGKHSLENLVTLCTAHHHATHNGKLIATGSASSHLCFTHADGTPYGGALSPAVADARAKAFQALTCMGFREGEVRRAIARVPTSISSLEQLVRQALRELASQ